VSDCEEFSGGYSQEGGVLGFRKTFLMFVFIQFQ